ARTGCQERPSLGTSPARLCVHPVLVVAEARNAARHFQSPMGFNVAAIEHAPCISEIDKAARDEARTPRMRCRSIAPRLIRSVRLVTTVPSLTLRHMLRRGLRMLRRLAQGTIVLAAVALFAFAWRCDGAWFDKHVFLPQQFFIPASRGIVATSPSLIFTGESTMAGFGLQWEETFPVLLGTRLQLQVVNLASPAYRADQSWLRLTDALPNLEHPVAVVGIFMPGLVGRSFVPPEAPTLLQRSGLYRLWKHLYWSDAAVDDGMRAVAASLRDMAALAKARGAPCIFLVTGRTPQWMLHELFEVPALDAVVVEVPQEELLADGHPGPRGSIRIAN